ncbi:MAG: flagellar FlbD family protein [Nocardioides sp.]
MVTLTRITGTQFALNPDLIERVDRTPDTVITLVDGTKYLVREGLDEVVAAILEYRAQVLASASAFERVGVDSARRGRLAAVPETDEADEAAPVAPVVPVVPLSPRIP